ncbi:hypothetical protein [Chryseobacterium viscerum]|uniref:DUF4935 domain-containing protein n=1 Tax=Chryseobacterium viscerum TaxID=1037377 RepID=A0A5N4BQV9_9FLAO|nr:hypothetical protein [Chryseobacterium viscerum]KAB1230807.1 hypothetical protein F8D52_10460 [Chryseobacterium viscerum]
MIRNRPVKKKRSTATVSNTVSALHRNEPGPQPRPEPRPRNESKVLIQPGYATGDMFGIAAALIDDDELNVVISKGNGTFIDHTDKADSIKKFYKDSGIGEDRIHVVEVNKLRGDNAGKRKLENKAREFQPRGYIKGVNYGTDYIARKYSPALRDKLKEKWKVNSNNDEDEAIKKWLEQKGIPTSGTNLLILWSRFSGKGGDTHIEHDTSYTGIRQIIYRVAEMYDAIIITGDKGYVKEKESKFDDIVNEVESIIHPSKVFNITEFWNEESESLFAWGGNTRFGQFKLYDYFERHFTHVKHLGFRSGNLEVMAMLGYKVRYMEEEGSESGSRMFAWRDVGGGKTQKRGDATGYERLLLSEPPTRSGKFLQEKIKEINQRIEGELDEEINKIIMTSGAKTETQIKYLKEQLKPNIEAKFRREKRDYIGAHFSPRKKDGTLPTPIPKEEKNRFYEGFNDKDMDLILTFLRPERWIEKEIAYNPIIPPKMKVYERLLESSEKTY